MKKTRAFALLISFFLIMGIAFAAEITGDLGPDQNTDSGLTGTSGFNQTVWYVNGTACDNNTQCQSQFCAIDYDAVGTFCAAENYCTHDGTSYATGSKTCYSGNIKTCTSGIWVTTVCSSGCTSGVCNSSSGTTCGNGTCESGETCTNCETDCGACDVGSGGTPGGGTPGGGTPSTTPTPTPTPSPTPTPEKILEETQQYNPTEEQIDNSIVGAGITDPEKKQQAKENTLNLLIEKTLLVEENGDGSFKSTVTIKITNNSSQTIENGEAYEFIPKEFIANFEDIQSSQEFELVGETDEFYIIKWTYGPLAQGESASFSYWVLYELTADVLNKSQSLFAGEKQEIIVEKLYGSITVNVLFEGEGQQGISVSLFKNYVKTDTKTTNSDGIVEFTSLEPDEYWVSSQETNAFKAGKSETISLKVEENAILTLKLEKIPGAVVPGEGIPWDLIGLILLILAVCIIGYLFKDQLLVLFAGKKVGGLEGAVKKMDKEARRPFKKSHEARIAAVAAKETEKAPEPKPERKKGKTFKCDECGKEFHTKIALRAHERHH